MLFKFKQSKIVVDCFTADKAAFEVYKIRKAIYYYPETIKNMEGSFIGTDRKTNINFNINTLKKCPGVNSLYKHGIIIPLWADLLCQPTDHLSGAAAGALFCNQTTVVPHDPKQYSGVMDKYFNIKLPGIWHIKESSGINFMWQGATWNLDNQNENFIVVPGIVDYKWTTQTNVNLMVKKELSSFQLTAGVPLVHIIPITEKEVEYKCHLISTEEYWSKVEQPLNFNSMLRWKKEKTQAAKLDEQEKRDKKCPFGFGK
jgi:hypothetical protein